MFRVFRPSFADDVNDNSSSSQVINYVENQSNLNLANSTTVGGNSIVTSATTLQPNWNNIQNKPAGFLDDTDNVLSPSEVESYVESTNTESKLQYYDWWCGNSHPKFKPQLEQSSKCSHWIE